MAEKRLQNLMIENSRIIFRNFAGNEGQYNRAGDRNFCVPLEPADADAMMRDGWNVKFLKPREEGDEPQAYLKVKVNLGGNRPPKIVMVTSRGRTTLDDDMVGILDWADIASVDMMLNPYSWDVNGKSGITAYLKSIFVTIQEDELDLKYANVPDYAMNSIGQLEGSQVPLQIEADHPGKIYEGIIED